MSANCLSFLLRVNVCGGCGRKASRLASGKPNPGGGVKEADLGAKWGACFSH